MKSRMARSRAGARRPGLWCLALLAGLAAGCASAPNPNVVSPVSTKLSTFNYKDEGSLLLIVVGTEAAQYNVAEKYFPLFITVANKQGATLHITPESFSFEDSLGRRYSPLPSQVIQAEYHRGEFDRKLFRENYAFTASSVDRYTPIPSNFYPSVTRGIIHDDIQLPRFGYLNDLLYFPVPEQGVQGGPFRLSFKTPEMAEGVVVAFNIGKEASP